MTRIGVCSVLATLLMTTVKAEGTGVSFWRKQFTMTCPEEGDWYKGDEKMNVTKNQLTETYEDNMKRHYQCRWKVLSEGGEEKEHQYHFYVRGRVCESCFELDGITVFYSIIVDLVLTGLVIWVVYKKTKKREPASTKAAPPHARGGRGGPPVPSPDYEPLNPRTRSTDPYSTVNRMG